MTPDPLEPLRKMIEKWRETAKYIAIGNSVGAGCLVQAADELAAALPALEEAMAEIQEPMDCGHFRANLQPSDSGHEICIVCAERDAARGEALRDAARLVAKRSKERYEVDWHSEAILALDPSAVKPKFKVGQRVLIGLPPKEYTIRGVYFSEGGASAFAPRQVFRYLLEGCDDSFAPVEELLEASAVKAAEPISEALRDCRDRAAEEHKR
jgi:hypothetical protein